jgi:hypothetical protein
MPASAASPLVRAKVDPSAKSTRIARHFLGISAEYRGLLRVLGHPQVGVNPVLAQLLANLSTAGQGAPGLRIGGSTADSAWWNPGALERPNGLEIDLGPYARDAIAGFEHATRAPLILGVNLAAGRVTYARDWASALLDRLPRGTLEALEVGNEPDVYATGRPFGTLPRTRPKGYSWRTYMHELKPFTRALHRLHGHPLVAGPATCCGPWERHAARIVRSQRGRLGLLTFHAYATSTCPEAPAADRLTTARLLGDATLRRAVARLAIIRAQAAKARRPVRISSTNAASCGGRTGITDTFASSLWMTDWLFLMAAQGFEGVNIQTGGNDTPFIFGYAGDHFVGNAAPSYYGMLLFARAIADHARLLVGTTLSARARGHAPVHVWATADRHQRVRVVVVNKDRRRAGRAVITVRGSDHSGTLQRLTAPTTVAKTDITLGGLAIRERTTDGRLVGTPAGERIRRAGHTYRFWMPPASAALLTVRTRG